MKKLLLITCLIILSSTGFYSQNKNSIIGIACEDEEILAKLDKSPEFPGGIESLMKFINKNLKYPTEAAKRGIQGRVIVKFIIDKKGDVRDAKVIESNASLSLNKEALRVVNLFPRWKPAEIEGKPVSMYYKVPITFKLNY